MHTAKRSYVVSPEIGNKMADLLDKLAAGDVVTIPGEFAGQDESVDDTADEMATGFYELAARLRSGPGTGSHRRLLS